jgi:excisionase family DNA binding protein
MIKEFLTIDDVCGFLSVKKSFIYSLVESGVIPHYRIGKLIRFKKSDIDNWMENQRRECINVGEKTKGILKAVDRPRTNIDSLIKKSIAQVKELKYNPSSGNQVESSTREGGDHGIV